MNLYFSLPLGLSSPMLGFETGNLGWHQYFSDLEHTSSIYIVSRGRASSTNLAFSSTE
ncbi:Uncharacterized protein TCM_015433 isoform 1 [Theobroma cacao]|uniref:Uncharacterized protein isoform 1 n=1 Tax=Theobroma cacao TaxID=3641 RepID=A0A061G161_THECC|nr:Uncharacterized protein TCM_015433 isoform 1 [Theobroma cacao]EOY23585.1 Uncharacterized protein TCM_015433 isoform 1 [Theobroma cacao]